MRLLNESHISCCWSFSAVFFIFTARLSNRNADGRKSCHYYFFFFFFTFPYFSISLSTSPSPFFLTPFPLGYKLNLINDLFCLACLPLAMFSKQSNGNASLASACKVTGGLCCVLAWLVGLYLRYVLRGE